MLFRYIFPISQETLSNSVQTLSLAAYVNEYLNHPPPGKSYQYKSHIRLTTLEKKNITGLIPCLILQNITLHICTLSPLSEPEGRQAYTYYSNGLAL